MKTIVIILLGMCLLNQITYSQGHQVINGPTNKNTPSLYVSTEFKAQEDVIGVEAISIPAPGQAFGIGGKFTGGFEGLRGESFSGTGVYAISDSGIGLFTSSTTGFGLRSFSVQNTAISATTSSGTEAINAESFADKSYGIKSQSLAKGGTGTWSKGDSIGIHAQADGLNSVGVYAKGNRYRIRASGFTAGLFDGSIEVNGGASLSGGVFSGGSGSYRGRIVINQTTSGNQPYSAANGLRLNHHSTVRWWTMYLDESNDDLNFEDTGILRAYIDNGNGNFSITSDRRLKQNIEPFTSVLPRVMDLRPSKYYYKDETVKEEKSWGFIAQEVEEIFPDIVKEKNGIKTLAYDNFAILAIKAIQEQQEEINSLKDQVASLLKIVNEEVVSKR